MTNQISLGHPHPVYAKHIHCVVFPNCNDPSPGLIHCVSSNMNIYLLLFVEFEDQIV